MDSQVPTDLPPKNHYPPFNTFHKFVNAGNCFCSITTCFIIFLQPDATMAKTSAVIKLKNDKKNAPNMELKK